MLYVEEKSGVSDTLPLDTLKLQDYDYITLRNKSNSHYIGQDLEQSCRINNSLNTFCDIVP